MSNNLNYEVWVQFSKYKRSYSQKTGGLIIMTRTVYSAITISSILINCRAAQGFHEQPNQMRYALLSNQIRQTMMKS